MLFKLKKWIIYSLMLTFVMGGVAIGILIWSFQASETSTIEQIDFKNRLKVPKLLAPKVDHKGRKVFNLTFQEGKVEFLQGKKTKTWGINQPYLAPTIRVSRGDQVSMNVTNHVGETTTLHWHGMILPAKMDGGPHQMIEPGQTWSPSWKIDQPASTTWFHPHLHGETAEHVYRGAAGMLIIDDEESERLSIPKTYGVDDIPLIVQDKNFAPDGSLSRESKFFSNVGILGDEILVNGTHSPYFEAKTSLVRFRLLNGSNARLYQFQFDDQRDFHLIATDSGLLEAPLKFNQLRLSPGERAEIVVKVSPGENVVLQSKNVDLDAPFWIESYDGGNDEFDILQIRANRKLKQLPNLPKKLVHINWPEKKKALQKRSFELTGMNSINGKVMNMSRIDQVVTAGSTEIWEVSNTGEDMYHNFHIHGVHFEILDVNGEKLPSPLKGLKDTFYLPPQSRMRLLVRFPNYADEKFPYMYHCHVLLHEDQGMMGQFVVVKPDSHKLRKKSDLLNEMKHIHE